MPRASRVSRCPCARSAKPSYEAQVPDRSSMLYEGTSIAAGRAKAVVVAVGSATEARRTSETARGDRAHGGVEQRLKSLMSLTGPVALGAGIGVVGAGLLRGRRLADVVGSGVSLAVAAVPEGLPPLAHGRPAVGREAPRVSWSSREERALRPRPSVASTSCASTRPVRSPRAGSSSAACPTGSSTRPSRTSALTALGCSRPGSARASHGKAQPTTADPMDEALSHGARRAGVRIEHDAAGWRRGDRDLLRGGARLPRRARPDRCRRPPLSQGRAGGRAAVVQRLARAGGPRGARLRSPPGPRGASEHPGAARPARGRRGGASGERPVASLDPRRVRDLTFRGFLAFRDPVRPSAAAALDGMHRAGVDTIMITGDHPSTAEAIAEELGLLRGQGRHDRRRPCRFSPTRSSTRRCPESACSPG